MNSLSIDYKLYLVTDRNMIGDHYFYRGIEEAIQGGVTMVQLREKTLSTLEFYKTAVRVKEITTNYHIPLIINDRLDMVLAVDADGLHIGQEDMPLEVARRILGNNKIIGVSAGTLEEALTAQKQGADYLGIGAVFPTSTKEDAHLVSFNTLKQIKSSVKIPIVAIGGIKEENAASVMKAGVDGISVISAILGQPDRKEASRRLWNIVSNNKS